MNETVKLWLKELYESAIEDAKGTISNERIWENGYDGYFKADNPHTKNIETLEEYIEVLKEKLKEIQ